MMRIIVASVALFMMDSAMSGEIAMVAGKDGNALIRSASIDSKGKIIHPHSKADAEKLLIFIDWGGTPSEAWKVAAAKSAMLFIPNVKVYVLTDDVNSATQMMHTECPSVQDAQYSVINLVSLRNKDQREAKFVESYLHSSENDMSYEINCFRRFFWLCHFMESRSIGHVLFSDHDIMIFKDIFSQYDLTDTVPFWSPMAMSSFFSYWSVHTLGRFCDFIVKFYQRPKDIIFTDMQRYGAEGSSTNHQPWMSPSWGTPKQFSDMYMMNAFVHASPDLKGHLESLRGTSGPPPEKPAYWYDLELQRKLFKTSGVCYTRNNNEDSRFQWHKATAESNVSKLLLPVVDGVEMAAMHLQGPCKSSMLGLASRVGITCPATA